VVANDEREQVLNRALLRLGRFDRQVTILLPTLIETGRHLGRACVGAHHPHLQPGTAGDWPLNVFDEKQAAAELPTLRAVASADLHNLVFRRDYRIIPAIMNGWAPRQPA
jgi:SpoVK/Ycf46/Vps4 family AAA+-type ATPase